MAGRGYAAVSLSCPPIRAAPPWPSNKLNCPCKPASTACCWGRQGLVQPDVKPANLPVGLHNGAITDVKITDFGSVLNLDSDVTQVYRVGSLAYMSPEQLDGSTLDCRADMYSLGAVLYHLISGRPPFDAQQQSAMMNQIYNQEPVPLT